MKTLKTNRKEIYKQAHAYILDSIDGEGYNVELNNDTDKLQFVVDTFNKECSYSIKRVGPQTAFENWLMGLPSAINIEFKNYRILEIAKEWGSLDLDATEKEEYNIINNWFSFIYMRFRGLCRIHGISI